MLSTKKLLYRILSFFKTEEYQMTHSGMTIVIRKKSGIVSIDISSISSLATGQVQIGTLPEGWRPTATVYGDYGLPSASSIATPIRLIVGIDGKVSLYNYSSAISTSKNYAIHITYLVA